MILFDAAVKRYGGSVTIGPLSMRIRPGEVPALLGPNGSGKTTTLKMAAGLIRPDEGRVDVGEPPRSAWRHDSRQMLSYLPQRAAFPDGLTGAEVIEFYRRLRSVPRERGSAALHLAGLNGASGRQISTYSGGMVQRLGLAVAMLPAAPAVLLDEPTAALDAEGLRGFYDLVDERRSAGATVLFSSHQIGDVEQMADRIIVLAEGRLVADWTRAELTAWLDERGVARLGTADARRALAIYDELLSGRHGGHS